MWPKAYRDYPVDSPLKKEKVEPGDGIIGCEMHDINGWGNSYHFPARKRKSLLEKILESIGRYFKSQHKE